jgi:hypothetical protein
VLPYNLQQYLHIQGAELVKCLRSEGIVEEEATMIALLKMNSIANEVGISGRPFDKIEDVLVQHRLARERLENCSRSADFGR